MTRLRAHSHFSFGVAVLLLAMLFAGCDQQRSESFSVKVRVENEQGDPIEGASVSVRPCYTFGCELGGSSSSINNGQQSKPAELTSWEVQVQEDNTALLRWKTASETNVVGFRLQKKVEGLDSQFQSIEFFEGAGTTSEPQSYEHETEVAPGRVNAFRLKMEDLDGSEYAIGDTLRVQPEVSETRVHPIFPNPFSEATRLEVFLAGNLSVTSRVQSLDGSTVEIPLVDRQLASGFHAIRWEPEENVPDGLYEIRTEIRDGEETVLQNSSYAALTKGPQNALQIGTTSADGRVSTNDRSPFPSLQDTPEFEVRDSNYNLLQRAEVSEEVQFVVTTANGIQTYRRPIVDEQNTFTLTVSP